MDSSSASAPSMIHCLYAIDRQHKKVTIRPLYNIDIGYIKTLDTDIDFGYIYNKDFGYSSQFKIGKYAELGKRHKILTTTDEYDPTRLLACIYGRWWLI